MKKLIEWLGFCSHQWEEINRQSIHRYKDGEKMSIDNRVGIEYTLRCKKCGKIKGIQIV